MSKEGSVAAICRHLRQDPRHSDIVRLLRRVWDMLQQWDSGEGSDALLGGITVTEVGQEMLYVASKIEVRDVEDFVTKTSGMAELLFQWSPHTEQAVREARMRFLGEEAVHDPEYALSKAQQGAQATLQFMPYITTLLATCAGLPAVQIKAVSRLIHLCLDPVTWGACQDALESAMMTLAAMANPVSSFRDEFQKMGGLACVVLCYLEAQQEERCNVFRQAVANISAKDLKLNVDADGMRNLVRAGVAQVMDNDVADRDKLLPELFANMFDTETFQREYGSWKDVAFWRKDYPSPFLRFVHQRAPELRKRFPHMTRHDAGLLLGSLWLRDDKLRRRYQWAAFPETKKQRWRNMRGPEQMIRESEEAAPLMGKEVFDWESLAADFHVELAACCVCKQRGTKLSRCGKCKWRSYCGQLCQNADWTSGGHKQLCGK